ncbi:MAG: nitronate monooxygenase [Phaeodactylibacter sp.]|uniref:NAD(P)H-dependent flavin oxidoreductase n=1 Tax=Phaeodactylibacter sp. TaxID=1940289 RepID=UPI0032F024CF
MKKKNLNTPSRRDFIKTSAVGALGLSTALVSSCTASKPIEEKESGALNESSKKLLSLFDLKYPFFQAAPGGENLAIAIANAGGMGCIQFTWTSPEDAFETAKRLNEATDGNYYANYVLHFEPKSLDKALEAGCKNFQFSWGVPSAEIVSQIRNAGGKLGIQVSSKKNAENALKLSPDFLICQGLEAGGHIQATQYNKYALPQVLEVAGEVPVLVSGGISTGEDIRAAIYNGAAGVVMGTRFISTKESNLTDGYRQKLLEAGENSTVYTHCFNLEWNAMHRVLRTSTFLNWEAEGCPLNGKKPREGEVIGKTPWGGDIKMYSGRRPVEGDTGDLESMCMYAGEGVSKINDIPTAAELIERLWKEFENK